MVDFKRLVSREKSIDVANLIKLFESLDRQTSHTELRAAQINVLRELSERRKERDLILKISTGAGKTAVALLFLQSHMEEKEEPVVYLCPTVQLVEQAQKEAVKLGLKAVTYLAGERYPPVDGTSAKAIIVCTYDKLFNAKTTFDRQDVRLRPCAIVLDDAHAGIEEIRDSFTLPIALGSDLHKKMIGLLDASCNKYNMGRWQSILSGDPLAYLEVPFWLWKPIITDVFKLLSASSEEKAFIFVWPFLKDMLRWCRCILSGSGIEIIPEILPVHKVAAYSEAKHRLFMSATLADDSALIRDLECSTESAQKPIIPNNDKGLGERMVLAPSLVNSRLDRAWVMELCKAFVKAKVNIVVLSPSEKSAREWEIVGAKVVLGDEILSTVESLKNALGQFVVFVQRYDGVDLPDSACRILVIDGMPYGDGIADRYDSSISAVTGSVRNRLIYRIEQGMGRAVRSHVDYAVIILSGPELANFIAKTDVVKAMNPDTRAQLKLALHIAKLVNDESDEHGKAIAEMMQQCLRRDEGWKQFYDESVRKSTMEQPQPDNIHISMAAAERRAYQLILGNSFIDAVQTLEKAIDNNDLSDSEKGWYLQKVANYKYEINPGNALEIQRSAHERNQCAFCPPGVTKRPKIPEQFDSQAIIMRWFNQFSNPNGAIAAIQELRAKLSYDATPESTENGIMELASLLGAEGSRPEKDYGEGPDDLWLWPSTSLIIEVKNENQKSLHKRDSGQLLISLQWYDRNYPLREKAIPVVIAKMSIADLKSGFPDSTKVITPDKMEELLSRLEGFYQMLIAHPLLISDPHEIDRLQKENGISPEQFIGKFTVPLK